jgi:hypothetical protein
LFAFPHPTALLCRNASPCSSTSSARPVQGLPGQNSQPYSGTTHAADRHSLQPVRSQARLQTIGSLHWHRSAYLEVTGGSPVETNDTPPYKHWHAVCAACGKLTLARPCRIPREIEPIEHNPVIKCKHCEDTRQYLTKECFLAPLSAAAPDKSAGALAVVAGLVAAVKLARVECKAKL